MEFRVWRNRIKAGMAVIMLSLSFSASAGVLMSQWTDGTSRYCKYSTGEVTKVSFGSICPATN